ncbi:Retrovirus-related Pol polyprotein from transposon TNT 1-94 [Dendrobium catenatum]|uniref:Retrovirus-related Pol polyprotein from transposon TNT 1-94 n=1 Tax=Dendrobium catenatum TaxID=906689 RepID=A0A2I0XHT9_9ASPA|nr:Retrovirus-related Pol polyprotein from transposon TNT 1-94 [Dendrobium catenatum]
MKRKSEALAKFVSFKALAEKQFNKPIKILRSDNGGEYINSNFQNCLQNAGIIHQLSCPYTPEQNGVAERKHRHIIETLRSLMFDAKVPLSFWVDTLLTAVYLINRLPLTHTPKASPYQLLYKELPNYNDLRTFGCLCYPWLPQTFHNKFNPKSSPCIFLGYASNSKGYKCYNISTRKIIISRHVKFFENVFPFHTTTNITSTSTIPPNNFSFQPPLTLVPLTIPHSASSPPVSASTTISSMPNSPPASPILTLQPSIPEEPSSNPYSPPLQTYSPTSTENLSQNPPPHPMITRSKTGNLKPKQIISMSHTLHTPTPTCYSQASKQVLWRQAMSAEFDALQHQRTWILVPPSPSQNVLGCKWIYKTKYNSNGSIARHKARLVAQGFKQEYGLDYFETFSPVAKFPTIRILLTVAVTHQWKILQLDVSNAFLHGDLNDTVYMSQPPGFVDSVHPDYVCLLKKSIYGLKQSPRQWFATFSTHLLQFGFKTSTADPSLLIYQNGSKVLYILIYVDDILLTGSDANLINSLLDDLHKRFQLKNLGTINQFLGISVTTTSNGLHLNQELYATTILNRSGMTNCKPLASPMALKLITDNDSNAGYSNPDLYRHLVGSLQYLTLTRPDIAYTVNKLCQFMHKPLNVHFSLLKRLLRYIKATLAYGVLIQPSSLHLRAFSDSDWAGDTTDRKSTTGYCVFLGNNLISWQVKKQKTVARSSTEAEYRSLATAAADLIWLKRLLQEFGIHIDAPISLFCDNISAIALANNPIFHARTKHIEIDFHFIRDCVQNQTILIHHINSLDQLADIFTKPLPIKRFQDLRHKLTLMDKSVILKGDDKPN